MFQTMLFLHLAGLIIWFGSVMAIAVLIMVAKRGVESTETKQLLRKVIRTLGWVAHPTAIIVLVSGVFMIIEMNFGDTPKPLWLNYMERGGGVIILVSIILTAVFGSKMVKRLGGEANQTAAVVPLRGGAFLISLIAIILAILSVILVVSLRL